VVVEVREKPVLPHYESADQKGKKQSAKAPSGSAGAVAAALDAPSADAPSVPGSIRDVLSQDQSEIATVTQPLSPMLCGTALVGRDRLLLLDIPESRAVALSVYLPETAGAAPVSLPDNKTPAKDESDSADPGSTSNPRLCWSVRLTTALAGSADVASSPGEKREKDAAGQNSVRLAELDLNTWTLQKLCSTLWSGERVLASEAAAQRRTHVPPPGPGDAGAVSGSGLNKATGSALLQCVPTSSCAPTDRLTALMRARGEDADQSKKPQAKGRKETALQSTEPLELASAALDAQSGGDLGQRMASVAASARDTVISPPQSTSAAPSQKKAGQKKDAAPESLLSSWLQEGLTGRTARSGTGAQSDGKAEGRGASRSPKSPDRTAVGPKPSYFRVRLGGEERAADEV